MPFRSSKQRAYFHYLKSQGKMDQATIDKWESHTPKDKKLPTYVEKKANMKHFWTGFEKRAAETFVAAEPAMDYPGAPEKMLKWNEKGGVDPRSPEELQAAQASSMVTLPTEVEGAACGTCMHFRPLTPKLGHGFCTNPEIKMDVTENMHCAYWQNPDAYDSVAAAEEEAQAQQAEQAAAAPQGMGTAPQAAAAPQGMGSEPQAAIPQNAPQQGMDMAGDSAPAQDAGGTGKPFSPSPVANQSGFPQGQTTAQNPLVEQAVQDFQGGAGTAGPTGGDGGDIGSASPKKEKTKKSDSKKPGHTININVGKEKTASCAFWKGIVEGY